MSMLLSQSRFRARVSCARPPVPIHVTKTSSSTDRHAQARLKGRLASLRRPLDCKNLTFLSTGAGGQHDREGQSWSSTADPYIRRPGWHRQQARAALSASLGLVRAAGSAKQLSRQNQNVQEAAQATPDRAWPGALIPARPPPTRPLPDRPRRPQSTFHND